LLGCTHYPLLSGVLRGCVGDGVAIVDSATATASSLAELLSVNGLEAPGTTRGTAADAGMAGHEPPHETLATATHRQLTSGDVAAFRAVAERMFGEEFPEIEAVDLGAAGAGRIEAS
jgi:glutamate racemase